MARDFILGPFNGAFLIVMFALFLLKLWAFVDALVRPQQAYVAAGKQTKVFWCVILGLAVVLARFFLLTIAGLIAAIVYLVDVRPAVRALGRGRGGGGGWSR